MADEKIKIARERFDACWSAMSENHKRMIEDLRFSNPADPQQWDRVAIRDRGSRPILTFDQSNQYLSQIVNDARQNKPQMKVRPVDDNADVKVAKALNGILYHIQDTSRADIAYDTAIESAARIGLGWLRVVPEVVNAETNEQEIRIKRVHKFDSIVLDDESTEPDGSDAMDGFAITSMSKAAFQKAYGKKASTLSFDDSGWFTEDAVRVAEYFTVEEKEESFMTLQAPDGSHVTMEEDEYWDWFKKNAKGVHMPVLAQWTETKKSVKWTKMSGEEELESTDFPASHIPLIPVIGNELWVDDKRYLCGMVRKGMDAQRAYNYARSTEIELTALQPKAPFMIAAAAVEGYEQEWADANTSRQAFLPWNHQDSDGGPVPAPSRVQPPAFPVSFATQSTIARDDLQAAFGMYKSNLGAPSNAISGRAKMQDQREGDTANFHYVDNLARSIRHMGSIVLEMLPKIYDTKRVARILGVDGSNSQVIIDPQQQQAYAQQQDGKISINPSIGCYDVAVSTGPAYATLRQEQSDQMTALFQANPAAFQLLGDLYVKSLDWPNAEEAASRLKLTLPPQVQQASQEGEQNQQVQQLAQQLQQAHQQLQQVGQAAQAMQEKLKEKADNEAAQIRLDEQKNKIAAYQAETARLAALVPADPALAAALYQQTLAAVMQLPTPFGGPPSALPPGVPPPQIQPQQQGPSGPFPLGAQQTQQGPIQ